MLFHLHNQYHMFCKFHRHILTSNHSHLFPISVEFLYHLHQHICHLQTMCFYPWNHSKSNNSHLSNNQLRLYHHHSDNTTHHKVVANQQTLLKILFHQMHNISDQFLHNLHNFVKHNHYNQNNIHLSMYQLKQNHLM